MTAKREIVRLSPKENAEFLAAAAERKMSATSAILESLVSLGMPSSLRPRGYRAARGAGGYKCQRGRHTTYGHTVRLDAAQAAWARAEMQNRQVTFNRLAVSALRGAGLIRG